MFQRSTSIIIVLTVLFLSLPFGAAQMSGDWRKHYGPPEAERYIVRDAITITVFYSGEGRTCKAVIEAAKLQPPNIFEDLLNEVTPPSTRGKRVRSIGLSSSANGLGVREYERVTISLITTAQGDAKGVQSATIQWKEVQCKSPKQN